MIADDAPIVLDTNILLHWLRGNEVGRAIRSVYRLGARRPRPVVPVVVKAEIMSLAFQLGWGADKHDALDALLRELPVADISSDLVISSYARLDSWSITQGRKMGKNDVWIAALAAALDATLLTMDNDFLHLPPSHLKLEAVDATSLLAASGA